MTRTPRGVAATASPCRAWGSRPTLVAVSRTGADAAFAPARLWVAPPPEEPVTTFTPSATRPRPEPIRIPNRIRPLRRSGLMRRGGGRRAGGALRGDDTITHYDSPAEARVRAADQIQVPFINSVRWCARESCETPRPDAPGRSAGTGRGRRFPDLGRLPRRFGLEGPRPAAGIGRRAGGQKALRGAKAPRPQ